VRLSLNCLACRFRLAQTLLRSITNGLKRFVHALKFFWRTEWYCCVWQTFSVSVSSGCTISRGQDLLGNR
jgi:hypothetical protein